MYKKAIVFKKRCLHFGAHTKNLPLYPSVGYLSKNMQTFTKKILHMYMLIPAFRQVDDKNTVFIRH